MNVCGGALRNYENLAHLHIQYGRQMADQHIFQSAVKIFSCKLLIFVYVSAEVPKEMYYNLAHLHIQYYMAEL